MPKKFINRATQLFQDDAEQAELAEAELENFFAEKQIQAAVLFGIYLGAHCQKYVPAKAIKAVLSLFVLLSAGNYLLAALRYGSLAISI